MSYPLSTAVAPSQATEADQYNNLRRDALYLGSEPAESGTVRDLLLQGSGGVMLSRTNKTTVTLTASPAAPCALMINGTIRVTDSSLTLTMSGDTHPTAGRYGIYALASSGNSFTITAATSDPAGSRLIGTLLWTGTGIIPDTVRNLVQYQAIQASMTPTAAHGRLSLTVGDPLPADDITMAENVYFVPYQGNRIGLFLYGSWEYFSFSSLSLSVSGLQRGLPYDVFIGTGDNGLFLSTEPWTGSTSRPAGTLTRIDGVRVSGADTGKRYLGSFAVNTSGYAEDSKTGRLLWNENNRAERSLLDPLTSAASHGTSAENAWIPYFDGDAPEVRILLPDADAVLCLEGIGISTPVTTSDISYGRCAAVGICRDMEKSSPYTGNAAASAIFLHSYGNAPMTAKIRNTGSGFLGYHTYTLAYWTNYSSLYPARDPINSAGPAGESPGLMGYIIG